MRPSPNSLYEGATVASLYLSAFKAFPETPAIVSNEKTVTYSQLEAQCYRIARLLRAKGLKRQDAVAFLVGNRTEAIIAIIAAQFIGLKSVSLHPMASEEDHAFVLQDAQVKALVVDNGKYAQRALAIEARGIVPLILPLDGDTRGAGLFDEAATMEGGDLALDARPGDITKLSYTGGTTGRSKGILHSHRTAVTMVLQMLAAYEWPERIRYLVTTPISHAAGGLILPVFIRGGTVYLSEKFTPVDFLERVRRHRINFTFLVPTQIYGLLDHPGLANGDCSSLELALYGAAPIAPSRLLEALRKIGPVFGQLYGQAEAPMTICYLRKQDHDPARPGLLGSCGKPVTGNQVKLLDQNLREVPLGEIGELCVRSPLIMNGYLNRPEEDEKVFAGDWLHTGDMARMDGDGYLYIVDRVKDMIITGGFNVYPSEVENCLALHPGIAMSAVIGVPDEKWGEAVTAIVVLKPGANADETEIIQYVTQKKGVVNAPKTVVFENQLPLTALGKIDRKTLRRKYWADQGRQVS
ncbi:3-[(3aS,4S,7aS)-7a-methyl-1,5-dioxo-octahydro-1H-inden-4-yl]propanoyl:CoA ligase [compost metagenome]